MRASGHCRTRAFIDRTCHLISAGCLQLVSDIAPSLLRNGRVGKQSLILMFRKGCAPCRRQPRVRVPGTTCHFAENCQSRKPGAHHIAARKNNFARYEVFRKNASPKKRKRTLTFSYFGLTKNTNQNREHVHCCACTYKYIKNINA